MPYKHHCKQVLVIGAGLAGLSAALRLARAGRKVILVEASRAHGGCCSTTAMDGYGFNNGAVYVAAPSLLGTAFARLGLDLAAEVPMSPIQQPLESHLEDGSVVHLVDATRSCVTGPRGDERTAALRQGLGALQRAWQPLYRRLMQDVLPHGPSPLNALFRLARHLPKLRGDAGSLIKRKFPDPALQAAIGSLLLYTGLPPSRLPASQMVGLVALLEEGFHLPIGGMGTLGDALLRHARAAGVELRLGARVERIEIDGGAVSRVVLADGERLRIPQVVATVPGFTLMKLLAPARATPTRLARVAARAPLSHRAISIQLGGVLPAENEGAFIVNHVPDLDRQGEMHRTSVTPPPWLAYTVPTRVQPGLAPPGKSIVECFAPATGIAHASEWTRELTEATVDQFLRGLRKRLPGLAVETLRVMDPMDFANQRYLHEGALYGIAPGALPHQFFPHRPGIRGLCLAGQTTFPGYGVAPAMLSGIQSADALLGQR